MQISPIVVNNTAQPTYEKTWETEQRVEWGRHHLHKLPRCLLSENMAVVDPVTNPTSPGEEAHRPQFALANLI